MVKEFKISTILNVLFVIVMLSYTYSWMVTEPSYGELVNYERDLIVASSGVDVEIYIYSEEANDYVLYEEDEIIVENMAPNDQIRFKFVMKNTKRLATLTDIVFANIEGDIDILEPYISFECSNPTVFTRNFINDLSTTSTFDGIDVTNYIKFYDDLKVEASSENIIYWSIKLDKMASNEIVDKKITIENIIFLNS